MVYHYIDDDDDDVNDDDSDCMMSINSGECHGFVMFHRIVYPICDYF